MDRTSPSTTSPGTAGAKPDLVIPGRSKNDPRVDDILYMAEEGYKMVLRLLAPIPCPVCSGLGRMHDHHFRTLRWPCAACGGRGRV